MGFGSWKILLIIVLASIVFSILYPFYSFHEGLGSSLSSSDITNIQGVLNTYSTTANTNCQKANNSILSLAGSDPQSMQITSTIQNNSSNTQCAILDQIANVATDTGVLGAVNTCYGENYAAVLNLLDQINGPFKQALANDANFAQIVKVQIANPSVSGQNSTFNTINTYISGALAVVS